MVLAVAWGISLLLAALRMAHNKAIYPRQQAGWTSTASFILCFSATLAQKNNYVPAGNCGVM